MCRCRCVDTKISVTVCFYGGERCDCPPRSVVDVGGDGAGLVARVGGEETARTRTCRRQISEHCHFRLCRRVNTGDGVRLGGPASIPVLVTDLNDTVTCPTVVPVMRIPIMRPAKHCHHTGRSSSTVPEIGNLRVRPIGDTTCRRTAFRRLPHLCHLCP